MSGINAIPGPWKDPLPLKLPLEIARPDEGWDGKKWRSVKRWISPLIGHVDDPVNQSKFAIQPDFGEKGHLYICVGNAVHSRMALRTLIASLMLDHSPAEIQIHCLDFSNAGLHIFDGFPHIGNIVQRDQERRMQRLLFWFLNQLGTRKRLLRGSNLKTYRACHENSFPALLLIIDGLSTFREDFERIDEIAQLVRDGQEVGIHLVLAGDRTSIDFSRILRNVKDLRLAIGLSERTDYGEALGESLPTNAYIPKDIVGRGFFKTSRLLECQVSDLEISEFNEENLSSCKNAMLKASKTLTYDPPVILGDELPKLVYLNQYISPKNILQYWKEYSLDSTLAIDIALDELTLEPTGIDLNQDGSNFIVAGPPQSGKTTILYSWVLALATKFPPKGVQFVFLDTVRESLAPLQMLPHVPSNGYALLGSDKVQKTLDYLKGIFEERRDKKLLKAKPAIVLIIDDAEFLTDLSTINILTDFAQNYSMYGFHILLSVSISSYTNLHYAFRQQVAANKSVCLVGSRDLIDDIGNLGLSLNTEEYKQVLPEGRAYLFKRGRYQLVQMATPGIDFSDTKSWIKEIENSYRATTLENGHDD